jgi:2-dehydro-3-deoxygluconokinase
VRLEEASTLDLTIGGSESNVAVALARLGRRARWLSALVDNPLGRRIATELAARGVDTSCVIWRATGRVGVYFLDPGVEPRPAHVHYDRIGSAVAGIEPDEIDIDLVRATRAVHLTGITPALSPGCAATCARLAEAAADVGIPLIFDVNYRSRLWSPDRARVGVEGLVRQARLLFCGVEDARTLWGFAGTAEEVARALLSLTDAQTVVLTRGAHGALAMHRDGTTAYRRAVRVSVVDPLGAGDAFAAGYIDRWLDEPLDLDGALLAGVCLAALKMTVVGDHASVTRAELRAAMTAVEEGQVDIVR